MSKLSYAWHDSSLESKLSQIMETLLDIEEKLEQRLPTQEMIDRLKYDQDKRYEE